MDNEHEATVDEHVDGLVNEIAQAVAGQLTAGGGTDRASVAASRQGAPMTEADVALAARQIRPVVESAVRSGLEDRFESMASELGSAEAAIDELREQLASVQDAVSEPAPQERADGAGTVSASMRPQSRNERAVGAQLDGRFAGWADFVRSALTMRGHRPDPRLMVVEEAADISASLTGEEMVDGGALVPEEFRAEILELMVSVNDIRSRAFNLQMGSSSLTIPRIRDVSRGSSTLFGGVQTYWLEAGDEIPESEPDFGQVRLVAKALAALTEIQNTLIADSFTTVPGLIARLFATALGWKEERSFLRDNGAGKPLGVTESAAFKTVARDTASDVKAVDIHKMEGALMPGSEMRAVWVIHPTVREKLGALNLGSVQYWQEDLSQRRPMTLNGRPILVSEHCPALNTPGDIMLVDFMYYLIADRQAMSLASSPHPEFRKNATLVRAIERLDAQPWIESALTLADGSTTVSPFVGLATK